MGIYIEPQMAYELSRLDMLANYRRQLVKWDFFVRIYIQEVTSHTHFKVDKGIFLYRMRPL